DTRSGYDIGQFSSALGLDFLTQATRYLIGAPLAQFIVAKQGGDYRGAIVFCGTVNILSTLIVHIVWIHNS
ncbi:hypothetical protein BGX26_005259, partial [Mortierella sp. AD094]